VNVAVERLPESQVLLDISTDEQEFSKALDRAYRKVVNQVRLPGFRPGKAPRMVIEQMLGRDVLIEQADRDLLDPLYQKAIEQESLNPVGEPEVEIYQTEPLAFKVTVQVYPTIDLGEYQSVPGRAAPGGDQRRAGRGDD
jgi:trigger factor